MKADTIEFTYEKFQSAFSDVDHNNLLIHTVSDTNIIMNTLKANESEIHYAVFIVLEEFIWRITATLKLSNVDNLSLSAPRPCCLHYRVTFIGRPAHKNDVSNRGFRCIDCIHSLDWIAALTAFFHEPLYVAKPLHHVEIVPLTCQILLFPLLSQPCEGEAFLHDPQVSHVCHINDIFLFWIALNCEFFCEADS